MLKASLVDTEHALAMRTRSASSKRSSQIPVDSTSKKRANSKEGSAIRKDVNSRPTATDVSTLPESSSPDTRISSQQPSRDAAHLKEGRRRTRHAVYVPAERNSHPTAPLNSDWMLAPHYFKLLDEWFGPFDVDCCAAKDGNNKQPTCKEHWFEDGKNCFDQVWDGKRIYCNPPWDDKSSSKSSFQDL